MSNRINGDFNAETIEAFRSAYAAQILEPEDQEVDERTGLPTNLVLNTSPWIQHTGLWKANDGTDKNFVPNQTLVPGTTQVEEEEDLTEEDIEELLDEVLNELEIEELLAELEELEDEPEDILSDYDTEEDEEEGLTDEEFEDMLEDILSDYDTEEDEDEALSEEEIDALIAELEEDLEG
jgi:molecular chaperone DnaK (HSP70)